jgi:hypothetical protein
LIEHQQHQWAHLTCQQQAGISAVGNLIDQAGCVCQGACAAQLAEGIAEEFARQCAAIGAMHHHAAQTGQSSVTAERLEWVIVEKRALQQSPLQVQAGSTSQVKVGIGKGVSQTDHQAFTLLGRDMQQIFDSFFRGFGDMFGLVSFEQ